MSAAEVLDLLVRLASVDVEVEGRSDGSALVWILSREFLALRALPDGTWRARWRATLEVDWTHQAELARDVIVEVVSRRIAWGWGFAGELLRIKRVAAAVAHLPPFSAEGDSTGAASPAGLTMPAQGDQTSPGDTREHAVAAEVV